MGRHPASDRVVLRYGLHLYKRSSTLWQVYIKLKKRDPIRKSLWTDDLAEARELAWQEYSDIKERLVRNEPLRAVTFKKLTEDYLLTNAAKPSVQYHSWDRALAHRAAATQRTDDYVLPAGQRAGHTSWIRPRGGQH